MAGGGEDQLCFRTPKVKIPAEEFLSHIPEAHIAFHGLQEQRASFSPQGNEHSSAAGSRAAVRNTVAPDFHLVTCFLQYREFPEMKRSLHFL